MQPEVTSPAEVPGVIARLETAWNTHDVDELVACFDPRYESEQPIHPGKRFTGADRVRRNWTSIFAEVPNFRAERGALAVDRDTVLSEWRWRGQRSDGSDFDVVGVMVIGVAAGRIQWARIYMEPVEADAVPPKRP